MLCTPTCTIPMYLSLLEDCTVVQGLQTLLIVDFALRGCRGLLSWCHWFLPVRPWGVRGEIKEKMSPVVGREGVRQHVPCGYVHASGILPLRPCMHNYGSAVVWAWEGGGKNGSRLSFLYERCHLLASCTQRKYAHVRDSSQYTEHVLALLLIPLQSQHALRRGLALDCVSPRNSLPSPKRLQASSLSIHSIPRSTSSMHTNSIRLSTTTMRRPSVPELFSILVLFLVTAAAHAMEVPSPSSPLMLAPPPPPPPSSSCPPSNPPPHPPLSWSEWLTCRRLLQEWKAVAYSSSSSSASPHAVPRPFVTLAYAQSLDGCVATEDKKPTAISGKEKHVSYRSAGGRALR